MNKKLTTILIIKRQKYFASLVFITQFNTEKCIVGNSVIIGEEVTYKTHSMLQIHNKFFSLYFQVLKWVRSAVYNVSII